MHENKIKIDNITSIKFILIHVESGIHYARLIFQYIELSCITILFFTDYFVIISLLQHYSNPIIRSESFKNITSHAWLLLFDIIC